MYTETPASHGGQIRRHSDSHRRDRASYNWIVFDSQISASELFNANRGSEEQLTMLPPLPERNQDPVALTLHGRVKSCRVRVHVKMCEEVSGSFGKIHFQFCALSLPTIHTPESKSSIRCSWHQDPCHAPMQYSSPAWISCLEAGPYSG